MAVNGAQPFIKVTDSNGEPIVGAKLHVYEAGTTTDRNIYSDSGLSAAMTNPLAGANASNASGDFPRFYMQPGTYKLRAVTSSDTLIWEYDNIDTGTSAGAGALPIASGGTGATTAAAARTNLGAASASEVSELSEQIADFSASLVSLLSTPNGRLTLTSNTPVLVTGVSAGMAVYYTPYIGNLCPVFDGVQFNAQQFSELTLTLHSNHVLNSIYDCFVINDGGTIRLVTGPAWNTITAGLGARGTGAGTSELTRLSGIWVNANAMTARNGATTYSVANSQGTYVGSIYIDGTAGQITCHTAYGQSRKWGVWNAYNRKRIILQGGDTTASWTYTTVTVRPSNNSSANAVTVFAGLPEEQFDIQFRQFATGGAVTPVAQVIAKWQSGIGWNSTTVMAGQSPTAGIRVSSAANDTLLDATTIARYINTGGIGVNVATCLETLVAANGSPTITWFGGSDDMVMTAEWWG